MKNKIVKIDFSCIEGMEGLSTIIEKMLVLYAHLDSSTQVIDFLVTVNDLHTINFSVEIHEDINKRIEGYKPV